MFFDLCQHFLVHLFKNSFRNFKFPKIWFFVVHDRFANFTLFSRFFHKM